MKRNIAFILVFILILSLAGCSSDENKLVGTWYIEGKDYEISFAKDGTGALSADGLILDFSWSISDGVITLKQDFPFGDMQIPYKFAGSTLMLSLDGGQSSLKKK